MISPNYLYSSVLFYLICKIVSCINYLLSCPMYNKSKPILTSIPENNESELDATSTKWVPKKKHEVLKAKYKCLKKLFQIYDASVIGILPETCGNGDGFSVEERTEEDTKKTRRKKRSHRTRTDACAGTTDISDNYSDVTDQESQGHATSLIRDLKIGYSNSYTATEHVESSTGKSKTFLPKYKEKSSSDGLSTTSERECGYTQTGDFPLQQPMPYLRMSEKKKPTRFQIFVQRLLGIRRERTKVVLNGHVLALSDNNINQRYVEKRRRRGLRFRRLRRPKKILSDGALRDTAPALLSYAQAVQRNCLLDTTPRQCPIAGCRSILYGIINYNDHLNMCHFPERCHRCHYCHEGFERESDKLRHENEHIGLDRFTPYIPTPFVSLSPTPRSKGVTSNTQTDPELTKDVSDEKLKKLVSFFDKIADSDVISEMKKNRYSESNLRSSTGSDNSKSETASIESELKHMSSCVDLTSRKPCMPGAKVSFQCGGIKCSFCGEKFDHRRQLSLHVDLEHRVHDKFSKFHSCAGFASPRPRLVTGAGTLEVTSVNDSVHEQQSFSTVQEQSSCHSSVESSAKKSSVMSMVERLRSGISSYKWEPGTKIIRV